MKQVCLLAPIISKSIVRTNQNDTNRIINNSCPETPDDTSKAEIEDYVTYQHLTPEHYEEINDEVDQKKEVLEETIIPVRLVDLSRVKLEIIFFNFFLFPSSRCDGYRISEV